MDCGSTAKRLGAETHTHRRTPACLRPRRPRSVTSTAVDRNETPHYSLEETKVGKLEIRTTRTDVTPAGRPALPPTPLSHSKPCSMNRTILLCSLSFYPFRTRISGSCRRHRRSSVGSDGEASMPYCSVIRKDYIRENHDAFFPFFLCLPAAFLPLCVISFVGSLFVVVCYPL